MNYLAIDTSTARIVLAASYKGKSYFALSDADAKLHNAAFLPLVEKLLDEAGARLCDMDFFAAVTGPGSFTGIRIGLASMNAMAQALGKKVVEMTALEVGLWGCGFDKALGLIDCKHGNYYAIARDGGSDEYLELNISDFEKYSTFERVYITETNANAMLELALKKAENNEYCSSARAFYLKKSSAEREAEGRA